MQKKLYVKILPIQPVRSVISSITGTKVCTTTQELLSKARLCSEALAPRRQAEHSGLASQEELSFSGHSLTTSIHTCRSKVCCRCAHSQGAVELFRAWRALGEWLVHSLNRKVMHGGGNMVDGPARSHELGVHAQTCVFLEAGGVVALARHDL